MANETLTFRINFVSLLNEKLYLQNQFGVIS